MSELHLVRAAGRRIEVRDSSGEDADPASAAQFVYLGRQPILDREGALNAYELLFRAGAHNYAEVTDDAQATAQVVARALGGIGVPAVLGQHRGFVNIDRAMLFDDIVHVMPPERFVLEILETVKFDAQLARRLTELRRTGFQVALDDVTELSDELLAMLPHADIVKIDFLQTGRAHLAELAAAMRGHGKTLIAEKIETREDFALARELGFDLFQGYFFARPQVLAAPRNRSPRPALLRLLALLSRDAGIIELEAELKLNPSVVVQLLRLVNSSAFGLGRNIASLREAIIATGTRQIARWAQLLLYADSGDLPWRADPLVQLAGTRSRFMELAAGWMRPADDEFTDAAFMTGIFSLVHVLLGSTPKAVLEKLGLAPQIREAIVSRSGPLGTLLRIAEAAGEGADAASIAIGPDAPPGFAALTPEVLAELNLSAAAWFGAHVEEAAA
ncbi:EAL and HDOD domain-containing protein [Paraburkholderia rhynchosiae]|uniref:Cyclic di-GMP phosphodiesterase CdgJ n=1 Tax=Paraburkholderia rhynchosiae TaxID=487049 RepID=A0A2N7W913_9BURK|nr:EAL domain-containing protein [Paraburkholderia rhynchosiae]PMS25869.1 diguanylate phosphodiesterase [Paraburkholderia rhynchosiae]CAB3718651.1 Cyclic di-GMP phosphodiesterase CdgJ [Paraburkholderia rhynchosiae]